MTIKLSLKIKLIAFTIAVFIAILLFTQIPKQEQPTTYAPCNGNGYCDKGEDKCTCAIDCGECKGTTKKCFEFTCRMGKCIEWPAKNCCGNKIPECPNTNYCETKQTCQEDVGEV